MDIQIDRETDTAYLTIANNIEPGEVDHTDDMNNGLLIDYDATGHVLGVEFLSTSLIPASLTAA